MLTIFSRNQFLALLIFSVGFLFSISLICTLILISFLVLILNLLFFFTFLRQELRVLIFYLASFSKICIQCYKSPSMYCFQSPRSCNLFSFSFNSNIVKFPLKFLLWFMCYLKCFNLKVQLILWKHEGWDTSPHIPCSQNACTNCDSSKISSVLLTGRFTNNTKSVNTYFVCYLYFRLYSYNR